MRKYWAIFKISWARMFSYRLNFLLGRFRNIVFLLLIFYVWRALTLQTGAFASYTGAELITYIFAVNILRAIIFGSQSRDMAQEINNGEFSRYLIQPVNFFWFNFFREAAQRLVNLMSAIVEVIIFGLILKVELIWQTDWLFLILFTIAIILAIFIYYSLSFLISLMAFWSREAMGPRFLFEWTLEFMSGAYFPLDILRSTIFQALAYFPFFYILFFPISIYLAKYDLSSIMRGIVWQILWLALISTLANIVWHRGLRKYSGEGI